MSEQVIKGFRLSPQQERLWTMRQETLSGRAQCSVRLEGSLDVSALQQAASRIIERHEILRTSYYRQPGIKMPLQVIADESFPLWQTFDLTDETEAERAAMIEQLFRQESSYTLEPGEEAPASFTLVKLAAQEHLLLMALPALSADDRTLSNLFGELSRFYAACLQGDAEADEPAQYVQFSEWQHELLEDEEAAQARDFWREQMDREALAVKLPFEQAQGDAQPFVYETERVTVAAQTLLQLEALARREGCEVASVLEACWLTLLWRLTSQTDIIVGQLFENRKYEELEEACGLLAQYVPVRCQFRAELTFGEVLSEVETRRAQAFELAEYWNWDDSAAPVKNGDDVRAADPLYFPLCFEFKEQSGKAYAGGLVFTLERQLVSIDRFKLKLGCIRHTGDAAGTLGLEFHYDPQLLSADAVACLSSQFQQLLASAARQPQALIGELELVSPSERQRLLAASTGKKRAQTFDKAVHQLFEAQAERTPERIALVCEEEQLTYAELNERANQLARHLQQQGVGADSVVALCTERSVRMMVGLLGILKAGAAFLPVEAGQPAPRLRHMLEQAGTTVVVTQDALRESFASTGAQRLVCLDTDSDVISRQSKENRSGATASLRNLAYVIYTSGSTGNPKGVMVEHRQLTNYVQAIVERADFPDAAAYATVSTIAADLGNTMVYPALCTGGTLHLISQHRVTDAAALADYFARHPIDCLKIVPSHLEALQPAAVLPRLRLILGGEASHSEWVARVQESAPQCIVFNHYGPTETTVGVLTHRLDADTHAPSRTTLPLGRPLDNVEAYVLDQHLNPVTTGEAGQLYIGGACVTRGYVNEPAQTAERFIPNPFSAEPGARLYRTGDLARFLPNGEIEFIGRVDHQVKVRGFRIELGEIEAALSEHSSVKECVVIVREDVEGDKRLVAYLTAQPDTELSTIELRDHLRMCLPDYMVPSAFVMLERLPLTPNGKVDRHALPAPADVTADENISLTSPRTPVEELLAGIWSRVLRIERVGVEQNFFELGGHSLLATQLISRVREAFGVELPLRTLFERPTVAALAESVEAALTAGQSVLAPPLTPVSREQALPLSFAQQRLWFLNQLEPDSPFYNVPAGVRLTGALDVKALERALSEIVRRHEVLRTTFQSVDGEPVQVIGEPGEVPLPLLDLCSLPESEREAEAERLAQAEAARPFDLSTGPLLRTTLLRLSDTEHVLLVTLHHIVSDGWSTAILIRELSALYTAYSTGMESPLTELPVQYADYSVWQREWLQGEVLDEQLGYWRQQLAGAPEVLELPTDRVRPAVQSFRGASTPFKLTPEVSAGLQRLSREQGVTLFMTLLAAFQTLLARYSGQQEIVVGTPIAGRTRSESEALIGFFVNTLALRTSVEAEMTFVELLRRVREVTLGAYAHQEVPFERLVEELAPRRELSHAPLFQVMLALQNAPVEQLQLGELELQVETGELRTSRFDLTLSVTERNGELEGMLEYSTALFDGWRMERLVEHFARLAESVVRDAQQTLGEIVFLGEEEIARLDRWNETGSDYERHIMVHELFEHQVAATPHAMAVSADNKQLSYEELNEQANQLAHYLQAQGVGAETRVGVLLERSPEFIVALLAILKAGGAYVPLDPTYPQERLRFMLGDAGVAVLITQEQLGAGIASGSEVRVNLEQERDNISAQSRENPCSAVSAQNLAYLIYTSGSTGRPKGVCVPHGGLSNLVHWHVRTYEVSPSDRATLLASVGFDASVWELWPYLAAGASVHIPDEEVRAVPGKLQEWLLARMITLCFLPTPLAEAVLALEWPRETRLRSLLTGGDRLNHYPSPSLDFDVANHYGPTESSVVATSTVLRAAVGDNRLPPIGAPIANIQVYVLDVRHRPVGVGVAGELYISGDGLARGYLNEPSQTAARFLPNPYSRVPGARMYRTGDLARFLPNGEIEFLGRLDHQVKVRGFRIELGEIEAALSEHSSVKECIVIIREDVEGDKRLVAYLSAHDGVTLSAGELRASLKERLPDYMVPSAFVVLERLPLTANGKVDRQALPAPEQISGALESGYVAPRTPVEEMLAGLWSEVLRVERVSIEDNFFELGGHSLLATQLVSRIREAFGVELPLRALFEQPSVCGLAERIEQLRSAGSGVEIPPLVAVSRDQALPLSFAQQRLWFLNQLEPESSFYNMPAGVRLTGALDVAALERALSEIVRRHEVLRTTFGRIDGEPVQVIASPAPLNLPLLDLQTFGESEREAEAQRLVQAEAARPFDLSTGPLLRTSLLRLATNEHILLVTLHHIISDGWSTAILIRELSALYTAYCAGAESPLSELPVQYADYSVWQRNWLQGEVLDEQLGYWRQQLAGIPEVLELPTDRARPAVQSFRGETATFKLTPELSAGVQRLSREQGVTLFMTLLAAFKVLLYRSTGQEDIVLGAPIAGRTQSQSEALIGFFINNLVLRTSLSGDPTFVELLRRVREVTLGAYAHQEVPFDKLVEELAPRRDTGFAPLFQATFGVQNAPVEELELGELKLSYLGHGGEAVRYDLTLWVWESAEGGTSVQWRYNTDLFTYEEVAGLQGQYEALLSHIVAQPDARLRSLEMSTEAEKNKQLKEEKKLEETSLKKLMALKRKPVSSNGAVVRQ